MEVLLVTCKISGSKHSDRKCYKSRTNKICQDSFILDLFIVIVFSSKGHNCILFA